jgi:two-component system nitrate/nitrite response regulator NarL
MRMKLLLVDKQPMIRSGLRAIISKYNPDYIIYEASSIDDSLNIIKKEKPQVIILDIDLYYDNGIDLMFKAKDISRESKFLVFTATITKSDFNKCEDLGVSGYVMKDALAEDVIFALNSVLRGRKYYDSQVVKTINNNKEDKLLELSDREKEVIDAVGKGLSNAQIASKLFISESTVKKYVSNILNKLGFRNRAEVICFLYNEYER